MNGGIPELCQMRGMARRHSVSHEAEALPQIPACKREQERSRNRLRRGAVAVPNLQVAVRNDSIHRVTKGDKKHVATVFPNARFIRRLAHRLLATRHFRQRLLRRRYSFMPSGQRIDRAKSSDFDFYIAQSAVHCVGARFGWFERSRSSPTSWPFVLQPSSISTANTTPCSMVSKMLITKQLLHRTVNK